MTTWQIIGQVTRLILEGLILAQCWMHAHWSVALTVTLLVLNAEIIVLGREK